MIGKTFIHMKGVTVWPSSTKIIDYKHYNFQQLAHELCLATFPFNPIRSLPTDASALRHRSVPHTYTHLLGKFKYHDVVLVPVVQIINCHLSSINVRDIQVNFDNKNSSTFLNCRTLNAICLVHVCEWHFLFAGH